MFLKQLFEAIDKRHAAFCFGRMNPPTIGHGQLINTVANSAAGGDYFIFTSQSHDAKKNPLDYATKIKFLKALFPESAGHVIQDPGLKTIMQVAAWLYKKGYRSVTFVAGSDRLADFKELLEKYNGVQSANGYYQFDSINFASSGDRDPDGDGLAGISATAAREAAKANNLEAFTQATGAGKLAPQLFQAVRKGMLLEGVANNNYKLKIVNLNTLSTDETGLDDEVGEYTIDVFDASGNLLGQAEFDTYYGNLHMNGRRVRKHDPLYKQVQKLVWGETVNEDASGYIPKNKKEAKDPRWSNALTVDVHPDTPDKNLKAFKLA